MDVFSAAASGIAVVSIAVQLLEECIRLRHFWESVREAPGEVAVITHDLVLLSAILHDISRNGQVAPTVMMGLSSCQVKVQKLNAIVEEMDASFRSDSRRQRFWGAFKAATRSKQLKDFRDSLNDTKSTVMLGILWQIIQSPKMLRLRDEAPPVQDGPPIKVAPPEYTAPDVQCIFPSLKQAQADNWLPVAYLKNQCRKIVPPKPINNSALTSNSIVKEVLQQSMRLAVDDLFASGTFEGLLENTINQVTEFETQSCGGYTPEDYTIQNSAKARYYRQNKDPFANFSRASRVCHRTSSVGVLFGSIWVRTSTLRLSTESTIASRDFQITTSFIFYPSGWLTRIGLGRGVEASLENSKGGWKFGFNPIRAVSDDSLIFELCRDGDVRGVERLLRRQEASLKDTSSQGWMPLHFAAEAGHVELCDMLIKSGADKRALVFKGPSEDALSPITIFAATNHHLPARHKIDMLRLFVDCLELNDPSDDGWTIHAELKRSYDQEKVPIPQSSISWLLRTTATEEFVAFGPKTIWSAVQSTVRSFLVHERNEEMLSRLLGLGRQERKTFSRSHATSIAHWLALRAGGRELLPMVIDAGRLCHITGFSWVEDELTPSQFVKNLPVLYHTWALAFQYNIGHEENHISLELETILERGKWGRENFLASILRKDQELDAEENETGESRCSVCHDDYSSLGIGVVSPAWITFLECTKTSHKFHCTCSSYLEKSGVLPSPPPYNPSEYASPFSEDEEAVNEALPLESNIDILPLCHDFISSRSRITESYDPFTEVATLLYRAQGRTWLSDYKIGEKFCATCFLVREEYIGKDGLGTETYFPEMPESFMTWRLKEAACTFDRE